MRRRSGRSCARSRPSIGCAVQQHLPAPRLQLQKREAEGGLAAAALADDPERLAAAEVRSTPSTARTWPPPGAAAHGGRGSGPSTLLAPAGFGHLRRQGRRRGRAAGCPTAWPRVGMRGAREDLATGPCSTTIAVLHHHHPVRVAPHDRQVVGDEQHRHAQLALQPRRAVPAPAPGWSRPARWSARRRSAAAGRWPVRWRSSPAAAARPRAGAGRRPAAPPPRRDPRVAAAPRTRARSAAPRSGRCSVTASRHLAADRVQRVEGGHRLLEHHAGRAAAKAVQLRLRAVSTSTPSRRDSPRGVAAARAVSRRRQDRAVTLLPLPLSPTRARVSPAVEREGNAVHHRRAAEGHVQAFAR